MALFSNTNQSTPQYAPSKRCSSASLQSQIQRRFRRHRISREKLLYSKASSPAYYIPRGRMSLSSMAEQQSFMILTICLLIIPISLALTTTESSTVPTTSEKITSSEAVTSDDRETTASSTPLPQSSSEASSSPTTDKPSSTSTTNKPSSTSTTNKPSSTSTTTTSQPQVSTEWQDIEEVESQKLVSFVVSEIQKLKVEHKELDECQELDLSSVLSGKKLNGKPIKYSVTLKVQPQVKNTQECLQQNSTMNNLHPEICEADVTEGDRGGTDGKTLLRSTCLQVEELQD